MTIAGSIDARAATSRIVVFSYPCSANKACAAARICARVRSDLLDFTTLFVFMTVLCQQTLTTSTLRPRSQQSLTNEVAMRTQTEILIVGAGPTGMALSIALHQAGVDHLLVDRLSEGQNTSRAGVIHAQTLDSLATLG